MNFFEFARKIQAIAQSGLAYSDNNYDRERYEQLKDLVATMLSTELNVSETDAKAIWKSEEGYATPKIDVRGAVFKESKILLVKERADGKWTLPGGWADVNDSPSEAVTREILEESGFTTRVIKLAAVFDRNKHGHPPMLYHVYKLFFICQLTGGQATISSETDEIYFFAMDNLPELSLTRVTATQIKRMFEHAEQIGIPTDFD